MNASLASPGLRTLVERVLAPSPPRPQALGLLLLRIYVGSALLIAHAGPKLGEMISGHGHFPELVASMGFPAPTLFAWGATIAQFGGCLSIIFGLATRLGTLAVLSTLVVGVLGVHWGDPFKVVEAGVAYMISLSVITLLGPGTLSFDHVISRRLNRSDAPNNT